jgi:hypothetical protein
MGTYKFMMGTYKFMMGTYKFMMGTYKMQVMHKFVLVFNRVPQLPVSNELKKHLLGHTVFSVAVWQKKIWCLPRSEQIFLIIGAQWSGDGKYFGVFRK